MLSGNADISPIGISSLIGENFSCVSLQLEGILSFWWWVSHHILSKRLWVGKVIVKINYPPVPKTDTQVTENLEKAIFFWWRECKHGLTPAKQTSKHTMADNGSSLHPWCSCTCISPRICPGQRFTIFPDWLKGLGEGLRHAVWWAMELHRNPEKAAKTL
jgi:hypothetical protein